jgi:hypothetical protein
MKGSKSVQDEGVKSVQDEGVQTLRAHVIGWGWGHK